MKSIKHILTLAACLLAGFAGMAQNNVIEGTNLKIGENNTSSGGFAIRQP